MSDFRDCRRVCGHRCLQCRLDYYDAAQVRRADIRSDSGSDDGAHTDGSGRTDAASTPNGNGRTDAGAHRSADCHAASTPNGNGCT